MQQPTHHHLAQLNIGRIRFEIGDPRMAGFVDNLLFFVAPILAGDGPHVLGDLDAPVELLHLRTEPSGDDMLLEAYLREP